MSTFDFDSAFVDIFGEERPNKALHAFADIPQPSTSEKRDKIFTICGVNFKMIFVEGGTFTMDIIPEQCNWLNRDDDYEGPTREVTLNDYYIGETQVTQALWMAVMGTDLTKVLLKNILKNIFVDFLESAQYEDREEENIVKYIFGEIILPELKDTLSSKGIYVEDIEAVDLDCDCDLVDNLDDFMDEYGMDECDITDLKNEVISSFLDDELFTIIKALNNRQEGDAPIFFVSWEECQLFIKRLNEVLSLQLNGKKFYLPKLAEWEYAAQGGQKCKGLKYSGSDDIGEVAWYCCNDDGDGFPHPVAEKKPNELGVYDMSGNIWEWCEEECGADKRIISGGSILDDAKSCRVSYYENVEKDHNSISDESNDGLKLIGFRLILR